MKAVAVTSLFFSLSIAVFAAGCASESADVGSDEGNLTGDRAAAGDRERTGGPTKEDSIACVIDGLSIAAHLGEPSGHRIEVKGTPGTPASGVYTINAAGGAFTYAQDDRELSSHIVVFAGDNDGGWALIDMVVNGDEDSGTLTVKLPGQPIAKREQIGGGFLCGFGGETPEVRTRARDDRRRSGG